MITAQELSVILQNKYNVVIVTDLNKFLSMIPWYCRWTGKKYLKQVLNSTAEMVIGNVIYISGDKFLTVDILFHAMEHVFQIRQGSNRTRANWRQIYKWYKRYIKNPGFRAHQETLAFLTSVMIEKHTAGRIINAQAVAPFINTILSKRYHLMGKFNKENNARFIDCKIRDINRKRYSAYTSNLLFLLK